jgi:LemA protein
MTMQLFFSEPHTAGNHRRNKMKNIINRAVVLAICMAAMLMSSCGMYNKMVALDEQVKAALSQVENVYQRRFDLIPNLVETVKGYAAHEKETFQAVTEARAKLGGTVKIDENVIKNPEMMKKYQEAQAGLGAALQRLMVVAERYPDLKANQNFRDLQAQLEGTENRIAVERRRFNEVVREYNTYIRRFPNNFMSRIFKFERAEFFKMDEGAQKAPEVKF